MTSRLSFTNQPPGSRFFPNDEVIIEHYLKNKITGNDAEKMGFIREVQFFKEEPKNLPGFSGIDTEDPDWFFFSPLDLKHRNGNRVNRKTNNGYWKETGKPLKIWSGERLIGKKKILVYYQGNGSTGKRTGWVVHEFHALGLEGPNPGQKAFVLCHLFNKSNNGSKGRKGNPKKARRAQSKLALASVTPVSGEEGDNHVTGCYPTKSFDGSGTTSKTTASTGSNHVSDTAYTRKIQVTEVSAGENTSALCRLSDKHKNAADNQVAEVDLQLEKEQQMLSVPRQNPLDFNPLIPLTSLLNTPAVSSPPTAEAESELALASVSPALGEEADNHVTEFYFNGMTSRAIAPTNTKENQVEEVTVDEVVGSDMFNGLPKLLGFPPLYTEMPDPFINNLDDKLPVQYFMGDLDIGDLDDDFWSGP